MGQKPDEIQREIEGLRRESDVIIDELTRRANLPYVARGVAGTVGHRAEEVVGDVTHRAEAVADDVMHAMPEPVRRYPSIVGGLALGLLAGLGAVIFTGAFQPRERRMPEMAAEQLREPAEHLRSSAAHFGESLRGGFPHRGEYVIRREEPDMFKRLVWVGLFSVMGALGAMLFQRLTASMWRSTMHEEPPRK